jgi:hypothetical protein
VHALEKHPERGGPIGERCMEEEIFSVQSVQGWEQMELKIVTDAI